MKSWLQEDIIGNETSQEVYGKQVILQIHENTESSIKLKTKSDLGNKLKVLSKERQNESTRLNESRVFSETILKLINTTFQHKNKHEDASVNDKITHTIVETSNASESNGKMITNNDKGGKEIVASGKIEIVKDTKNITIKQNTLDKASNVLETKE